MNNSFGHKFKVSIFGESHTPQVGVTISGIPEDVTVTVEELMPDLLRRKGGKLWTTARKEEDIPSLKRDGDNLTITFENRDIRPADYEQFKEVPRPGHADFTASSRGMLSSGGGIFSGRMTLPLVAAGVVAKKMITPVRIEASLIKIGGVPCSESEEVSALLAKTASEGDSLGGIIECVCTDVPVGIGEPFFDSMESLIAHAVFSVPGIRGIEFGDGFASASMKGSRHNDPFIDSSGHTSRNGSGGINGGLSNGNPIVFRCAVKPTSSIRLTQQTYDFRHNCMTNLTITGRHDVCFALRVPPVIEAVTAITLADFVLMQNC